MHWKGTNIRRCCINRRQYQRYLNIHFWGCLSGALVASMAGVVLGGVVEVVCSNYLQHLSAQLFYYIPRTNKLWVVKHKLSYIKNYISIKRCINTRVRCKANGTKGNIKSSHKEVQGREQWGRIYVAKYSHPVDMQVPWKCFVVPGTSKKH